MAEVRHRILFPASEAYPLIKTGGLGDVAGSLPRALTGLKQQVRLLLPAYTDVLEKVDRLKTVSEFRVREHLVRILATTLPGTRVSTWLVDVPELFGRSGNPYLGPDGRPWPDNAWRYYIFAEATNRIAMNQAGLNWQPDVVHCHDWQTGLIPALLSRHDKRPATVFTIHNLAYQGLFPHSTFVDLGLPAAWWSHHCLEFHGQLSYIKGGLVFADRLTTVSPTYAREIQTPEFGYGLDGLLRHRSNVLSGILNGIDTREWNPGTDPFLVGNYNRRSLGKKAANKAALQQTMGLENKPDALLLGFVGRLVEQKGIDIIIEAVAAMMGLPLQLVILGSGEQRFEAALRDAAETWPGRIAVHIGYSEKLAHQIEAGADAFLMPSRFEPCGLNQMYSMRYGTLPIVRPVGGLADTVIDANPAGIESGEATGYVIPAHSAAALLQTLRRTLADYRQPARWRTLQRNGMSRDFSWQRSAGEYLRLYNEALVRT
jgi:starch synthase